MNNVVKLKPGVYGRISREIGSFVDHPMIPLPEPDEMIRHHKAALNGNELSFKEVLRWKRYCDPDADQYSIIEKIWEETFPGFL